MTCLGVYNNLPVNDAMSFRNSLAVYFLVEARKINKKCIVELLTVLGPVEGK